MARSKEVKNAQGEMRLLCSILSPTGFAVSNNVDGSNDAKNQATSGTIELHLNMLTELTKAYRVIMFTEGIDVPSPGRMNWLKGIEPKI